MALGIDTRNLVEKWIPRLEQLLSRATFARDRYQVHRVYACATVLTQDEAAIQDISTNTPSFSVTQRALDWQPQDDDELNEGDVYNHLVQMSGYEFSARENSFLTNAESPTFAATAEGRPASAFQRCSFRLSTLEVYSSGCEYPGYHVGASTLQEPDSATARKVPSEWWESMLDDDGPELIWPLPGERSAVLWHVQVDLLDMLSPRSGRHRRRRKYGPFQQVTHAGYESPSSDDNPVSAAKRFNGVRYRRERKTFIAEMKIPKTKNKESFGDFKSAPEAARAVDAAYYYYNVREKVNFPDAAHILSSQPKPAQLTEKDMLKLVKERAKWLASHTPTLPSCPSSGNLVPETPTHLPSASSSPESSGSVGPVAQFDPWEFVNESASEHGRSMFPGGWSVDDDPFCVLTQGFVEQGDDGTELYSSFDVDLLCVSSSPGPNLFQTESPPGFQEVVADRLVRQQFVGFEDAGLVAMED